ncbi:MAG: hypothetical protein QOK02_6072, partial [Mycobacterium sp.]|nr:hypothetical protein [Mycobacterium sp.]
HGAGATIVVGAVPMDGAPTGTIGLAGVDVLVVDSECTAGGAFCPSGMTIGVALPPLPLSPESDPEMEFCGGGQSTDVGGQLSALPDPDESPGGGQPEPAPNSPAPVQSAAATLVGSRLIHPATKRAAKSARRADVRDGLTARGCRRRR